MKALISSMGQQNWKIIVQFQSVNFGRHLTEILYPFEISYQIFIHTLPYQYLSFRNFTLPKFSFEKSYLTKIFFSEMLINFTIIKVSVNRLYVNVTLRKLRWRQLAPAVDERRKTKTKQNNGLLQRKKQAIELTHEWIVNFFDLNSLLHT